MTESFTDGLVIYRREWCSGCGGRLDKYCSCDGKGYTETAVPFEEALLEVMNRMRWMEPTDYVGFARKRAFDCLEIKSE